ncbi:MAG: DUF4339 domain-containing protein [Verrucomicrobiota bacterium]|nr:DUF4339 domain-containing protein [Limisphaera sp.]MDW8381846.1 DUF4339 domain-containing protein [Verrucomicrobiota bacterium]
MYRIIGGDGREYGPVSAEQIRQWVKESRANAESRVCVEGSNEWKALREFPEFADLWLGSAAMGSAGGLESVSTSVRLAKDRVYGPAVGLLVTAGFGALANVLAVFWYVMGMPFVDWHGEANARLAEAVSRLSSSLGIMSAVLGLGVAALVAYGAVEMMKLRSFGWAMAASILAIVPCTSPCCLLGVPIGIWALMVLYRPEVQVAFGRPVTGT